jgi:hypothetical protein
VQTSKVNIPGTADPACSRANVVLASGVRIPVDLAGGGDGEQARDSCDEVCGEVHSCFEGKVLRSVCVLIAGDVGGLFVVQIWNIVGTVSAFIRL